MIQVAESKTAINREKLKSVMGRFMPGFKDCNQDDAFEFLLQFFDILHKDLESQGADKSIISELFHTKNFERRQFRCGRDEVCDVQQYYLILPIPSVGSRVTLESCLAEWTRLRDFNDSNPLWCWMCCCLGAVRSQLEAKILSKYVVVQFFRFGHKGHGTAKDARPIEYPLQFDSRELLPRARPTGTYPLVGVICHTGNAHSGHYTFIVRRSESSRWYRISDSCVWGGNCEWWRCEDAYILFYERQD
jgi:ubiquitin C-terminal hydrolase